MEPGFPFCPGRVVCELSLCGNARDAARETRARTLHLKHELLPGHVTT